jgi:hypothetical protein
MVEMVEGTTNDDGNNDNKKARCFWCVGKVRKCSSRGVGRMEAALSESHGIRAFSVIVGLL